MAEEYRPNEIHTGNTALNQGGKTFTESVKTTQDSPNEVFADPTNPKPDSSDHAYSQSAEPKPDFSDDAYPEPAEPDSSDEIFSEIRHSEEFLPEEPVLAEGTSLSFLPLTRIGIKNIKKLNLLGRGSALMMFQCPWNWMITCYFL